jgi:hypothetical protein
LVHLAEGPSGVLGVEISVQPAFMVASAFATTVAAERALVNWKALMTSLHPWVPGRPSQESQIGPPAE